MNKVSKGFTPRIRHLEERTESTCRASFGILDPCLLMLGTILSEGAIVRPGAPGNGRFSSSFPPLSFPSPSGVPNPLPVPGPFPMAIA